MRQRRVIVVNKTAKLHSKKPELKSCTGSNPTRGESEIYNGENLEVDIILISFCWSTIRQKYSSSNIFLKFLHRLKETSQKASRDLTLHAHVES